MMKESHHEEGWERPHCSFRHPRRLGRLLDRPCRWVERERAPFHRHWGFPRRHIDPARYSLPAVRRHCRAFRVRRGTVGHVAAGLESAGGVTARPPVQATLVRVEKTGERRQLPGCGGIERQLACELEVYPEGGSPYRARTIQLFTESALLSLQPGVMVAARHDPAKPKRVSIVAPVAN